MSGVASIRPVSGRLLGKLPLSTGFLRLMGVTLCSVIIDSQGQHLWSLIYTRKPFDFSMVNILKRVRYILAMAFLRSSHVNGTAQASYSNAICQSLVASKFDQEWEFVPESAISTLVIPNKVKKLVPKASKGLVSYICDDASRVFLTLWSFYDKRHLVSILTRFQEVGFDNDDLPVEDITRDQKCAHYVDGNGKKGKVCKHHNKLNVFHGWVLTDFKKFRTHQWQFSAVLLNRENFKRTFASGSILPFTSKGNFERSGHFGTVSEVGLRADSQDEVIYRPINIRISMNSL